MAVIMNGWVAWDMLDGNVMAGTIESKGYDNYLVKRVDGSVCRVKFSMCRACTPDDVLAACDFFKTLGR